MEGVSVTNGDSCKEAVEGKRTSIALWRLEFYAVSTRKMRGKAAKMILISTKRWSSGRDRTRPLNAGKDCRRKSVLQFGCMVCIMLQRLSSGGLIKSCGRTGTFFRKTLGTTGSLARSTKRLSGIVLNWLGSKIANAGLQCLTFCICCRESCTQPTCKGTIST